MRVSEVESMTSVTTGLESPELAIPRHSASLLGRLTFVLRVHLWLLLFVIAYFAAAVALAAATGRELILPWGYLQRVLLILGILVPWGIAGYSGYLLWKFRPQRPTAFLASELSSRFFHMERCSGAVLTLALLYSSTRRRSAFSSA